MLKEDIINDYATTVCFMSHCVSAVIMQQTSPVGLTCQGIGECAVRLLLVSIVTAVFKHCSLLQTLASDKHTVPDSLLSGKSGRYLLYRFQHRHTAALLPLDILWSENVKRFFYSKIHIPFCTQSNVMVNSIVLYRYVSVTGRWISPYSGFNQISKINQIGIYVIGTVKVCF